MVNSGEGGLPLSYVPERCVFFGNFANDNGGAINIDHSDAFLISSLFYSNEALSNGGALFANSSTSEITHCTITNNGAGTGYGGGLFNGSGMTWVNNMA